jgi:hypothetical protein
VAPFVLVFSNKFLTYFGAYPNIFPENKIAPFEKPWLIKTASCIFRRVRPNAAGIG